MDQIGTSLKRKVVSTKIIQIPIPKYYIFNFFWPGKTFDSFECLLLGSLGISKTKIEI